MQKTSTTLSLKMATALLVSTLTLSGCQWLGVYTIDVPQGTPITAQKATQVRVGMSQNEVLYVLGSPAMRDTLNPNRWDYIYDYTAGTDGKRAKKANIHNASQYLRIYFDNNGRVARIEGADNLPSR